MTTTDWLIIVCLAFGLGIVIGLILPVLNNYNDQED